jgi:hypothetical protein
MTDDGFDKLDKKFEILPFIASPNFVEYINLFIRCTNYLHITMTLLIPKNERSEDTILDLDCW